MTIETTKDPKRSMKMKRKAWDNHWAQPILAEMQEKFYSARIGDYMDLKDGEAQDSILKNDRGQSLRFYVHVIVIERNLESIPDEHQSCHSRNHQG